MNNKSKKILSGSDEIQEYLGISEHLFYRFLKLRIPLPAVKINGRWYAHAGNLDDYFKKLTTEPTGNCNCPIQAISAAMSGRNEKNIGGVASLRRAFEFK